MAISIELKDETRETKRQSHIESDNHPSRQATAERCYINGSLCVTLRAEPDTRRQRIETRDGNAQAQFNREMIIDVYGRTVQAFLDAAMQDDDVFSYVASMVDARRKTG